MTLLANKVAIITGASSGIGRATAKLFAQEGAAIIVGARRDHELDDLTQEIASDGGKIRALAGDVTDENFNKTLVELALTEFGGLDITFNNAGILGNPCTISEISLEDWEYTLRTNLTSGFLAAKYQIPAMHRNGGSIIFTSSFVGYTVGFPEQAAYAASKAGLIGLTRTLATEYGARGIRVNALLPGGTSTPMADAFAPTPDAIEFVRNLHALKRMAMPEEIAKSALYLASHLSSFTTGTAMLVDGGVSICKT